MKSEASTDSTNTYLMYANTHAGEALRNACQSYNVPYAHVAKHLGVSRQHIHNLLRIRKPRADKVERMADFFGVSVSEFLAFSHSPMMSAFLAWSEAFDDMLHSKGVSDQPAYDRIADAVEVIHKEIEAIEG